MRERLVIKIVLYIYKNRIKIMMLDVIYLVPHMRERLIKLKKLQAHKCKENAKRNVIISESEIKAW